jgi:hypothetical protein
MAPIILHIPTDRSALSLERAFRFLWVRYVVGFDPNKHCQSCLLGRSSAKFRNGALTCPATIALDEFDAYDYIYVCGVAPGQRWVRNLHLAVRFREGSEARARCYSGQEILLLNGENVEIPPLPDGFNGKNRSFTTCRNYQFGVAMYQHGATDGVPSVSNPDGTYGRRRILRTACG